jgi:hypothetical protein
MTIREGGRPRIMRTAGVTAVTHDSIPNMKNPLFGKSLSNPFPEGGD